MKIPSIEKLLEDQLKDLYNAENQLVKALPKMAKAASSDALKEAFTSHLEETRGQVARLNEIGKLLGFKLSGKKCVGMEGLIEEGKETIEAEGPGGCYRPRSHRRRQKVEHYEISGLWDGAGPCRTARSVRGCVAPPGVAGRGIRGKREADGHRPGGSHARR